MNPGFVLFLLLVCAVLAFAFGSPVLGMALSIIGGVFALLWLAVGVLVAVLLFWFLRTVMR